jgi:serine/threonine protein kinase
MAISPGARIGPYQLVSLLGEGGIGHVHRATDTRLDHTVAVKVLPPDLATAPVFPARSARVGKPVALFRAPIAAPSWGRNHYQPSADGQRFLINVLKPNELKDSPELVVVLDWAQSKYNELRGDTP